MKVLLFDLGGTILDNCSFSFINGMNEVLKYSNITKDYLPFVKEEVTRLNSRGDIEFKLVDLLQDMEKALDFKFNKPYKELELLFFNSAELDNLVPNVEDALKVLKEKNFYLGIISNSIFSGKCLFSKIESFGLGKYFDFILASADVGYRKPNKIIFDKAMEIVKENITEIDKVYYIGDIYKLDVLGSYNAGLIPIWLNQNNEDYNKDNKFMEFHSYNELIEALNKNKI